MPPLIGSSVGVGWEDDIPELGRGRQELDGNERALLVHLRRANNIHFHALLRSWIFEGELSALGDAFGKNNHGPAGANGVSKSFDRLGVFGKVGDHGHTQENTLRAAALFGGRLPSYCGTHPADRAGFRVRRRFHVRRGFHRSIPQKSISGATNSTPYSQPSGRWLPFHTMIAALLVSETRLVRASRCSRLSDCDRTSMHP